MTPRTFRARTPLQALVVEQALLLARPPEQTAGDAPDGQGLGRVEALAVPAARGLARPTADGGAGGIQRPTGAAQAGARSAARRAGGAPGVRGAAGQGVGSGQVEGGC